MRLLSFGLAAAMALTALAATTSAFAKDNTNAAVSELIATAKTPCTVTDSRSIGDMTLSDGSSVKVYEAACQEGLGYVLIAKGKTPPQVFDCFAAGQPDPKGKPNPLTCKLPANANPSAGLQPLVDKTGVTCAIDKARAIGSSPDRSFFELACKSGTGLILSTPVAVGGTPPTVDNCLAIEAPGANAGALKCILTTPDQQLAVVDTLAAASGKPCTVKTKRYVMTATSGDSYYEVACTEGKGYMVSANSSGKFSQAIDCTQASGVDGGCTLTDTRQLLTEEADLYSRLSKKAGFDCQVSKYGVFASQTPGLDAVELQCSNRPDGGVGLFPASGAPQVYDCLRAANQGYGCSMTPTSALYSKLSAELRAKNKPSCVVSGARSFGRTSTTDLVEVACADGGPGWVLEYASASANAAPATLLNCAQAAAAGGGGCQLPTNRKQ